MDLQPVWSARRCPVCPGLVADWLGVRFWCTVGGTICILVTVVASLIPTIMNIERNQGSTQGVFVPD